jgi:glycine oxidase
MGQAAPGKVLIIGDGLAGALMAWECQERGLDFEQWSNGSPAASDVAAGMFNPVSFRRILPQWDAANHSARAREVFGAIESKLGIELWHDVPIVRVFPDEQYAELWSERANGGHEVSPFIETLASKDLHPSIKAPHGAGIVREAGWVDVSSLTEKSRAFWQDREQWKSQSWSMDEGCPTGFGAVIDCRGVGAAEDLAAFGLELRRNHGEVITVQTEAGWGDETVNNVTWALPLGSGAYRIGSTYRWDIDEPIVLKETLNHLVSRVNLARTDSALLLSDVTSHRAGLRPSCFDRRPILGRVTSEASWYVVCTGWGTRGVSIGPTMVDWTIDAMLGVTSHVPDEVHPKRFRTFTKN